MLDEVQSKCSLTWKVHLVPLTDVREEMNGQVKHRLREQRNVPGMSSEGCVPKKDRKLRARLKDNKGRWLKISVVVKSEWRRLKLWLMIGLMELLLGWKVRLKGIRSLSIMRGLGVITVLWSIEDALCLQNRKSWYFNQSCSKDAVVDVVIFNLIGPFYRLIP